MHVRSIVIGSATVHVALLPFSGRPTSSGSADVMRGLLSTVYGGTSGDWSVAHDANGAPLAYRGGAAQPFSISISRTEGLAAAAVSSVPVGIDVERMEAHDADPALAETLFSAEEQAHLDGAGMDPERFFRIWTLKEAYIKARGLGFGIDLPGFSVVSGGKLGTLVAPVDDPLQWALHGERLATGHAMGLAVAVA